MNNGRMMRLIATLCDKVSIGMEDKIEVSFY